MFPLAVVSLIDTEELSSTEEEEEGAEAQEEDSGSEVEIIEEVKGNGTQQQQHLYLQEQTEAVLSLVTDPLLKVRRSSHHLHFSCVGVHTHTFIYS